MQIDKLPTWAKVIAAAVVAAILFGASRLLLYLDKLSG